MSQLFSELLNLPLVFVDLETTGQYAASDRIIEVGIVKVQNNEIVEEFSSVINPKIPLSNFTVQFTGITQNEADNAPTFEDIAEMIHLKLEDTLFVAQNVEFDYGFLEESFKKVNKRFLLPKVDTIRITKKFYPNLLNYKLDTIARLANVSIENRHRALGDAKALWEIYKNYRETFGEDILHQTISEVAKVPKDFFKKSVSDDQMSLI